MKHIPIEEENQIIELYLQGFSSTEIGKKINRGYRTVQRVLHRRSIIVRSLSESQFIKINKKINPLLNNKEWLEKQHLVLNKTCKDIGEELNVSAGTVRRHMKSLGIHTKTNSESKIGLMCGEKHPNWKGGVSELNQLLREYFQINIASKAAKRDNYTCQLCGKTHTVLHIHHIIPFASIVNNIIINHPELNVDNIEDKQKLYDIITQDKLFNDLDNLITCCKECHFFKIHNYNKKNEIISSQACEITQEGSETIQ